MKSSLMKILACPKCKGELVADVSESDITTGTLECMNCKRGFPVVNGIPRFVEPENYASSFGFQWNLFRKEQIDSFNGTTLSADRFWSETEWTEEKLAGKWILDAGCGAGRFLDVSGQTEAEVVGIDLSNAIDAAKGNLAGRENVNFVQASIYELPFREGTFDNVYCIGVVQHTPDREKTLSSLSEMVKEGGELAVTIYPRKPWTKLYSKYWFRPITKRLKKETLLGLIRGIMPAAFPITNILFRLPLVSRFFMFIIPIANYVNEKQLTREQRYNWAILDTFDMLSPYFDQPMTESEARQPLEKAGLQVRRLRNAAICLVGSRRSK